MRSSQPGVLVVTPTEADNESLLSACRSSVAAQTVEVEHAFENDEHYVGPGVLRDRMVAASDAEWVLPLDDTDTLDPQHVETGLQATDDADIIYQWCRVEGSNYCPNRLFNAKALRRFNYLPATSLIRRSLLDDLGGFKNNNPHDLWLRALKAGARFKCIPEVTWTFAPQEARIWDLAIRRGAIQKPGELRQLVQFVQSREKAKTVLEVGTARGGTLWMWCQLADPHAFVISVDLPGGAFGGGYDVEDVPRLMKSTIEQQKLQLFRGDSHDPNMLKACELVLEGRKVDILFLDGDHTYEGVKQDWETYSPLVRPGGIVVFHDIVDHFWLPECKVYDFWQEIKGDYEHQEFITPVAIPWMMTHELDKDAGADWGGIGVIHIP
jgi:cephalosporin hydroxylase